MAELKDKLVTLEALKLVSDKTIENEGNISQLSESIVKNYSELKSDLTEFTNGFEHSIVENKNPDFNNIINWDDIHHKELIMNKTPSATNGYWNSGLRKVKPNTQYVCFRPDTMQLVQLNVVNFYSSDNLASYISQATSVNTFTTPLNCEYVVINKHYTHSGANVDYSAIEDYDDFVNKIIVNVGNSTNKTIPYDYYLNEDIKVVNSFSEKGKTVFINDAIKGDANIKINRSVYTPNTSITIKVVGENIFDGITQNGYWDGTQF